MALGYALHEIHRGKEALPAGAVHLIDDKDFDELTALGAVREPTADEVALYRLAHPEAKAEKSVESKVTDEGGGKRRGKSAKAAEAKTEEKADEKDGEASDGDADPEVTEDPLV